MGSAQDWAKQIRAEAEKAARARPGDGPAQPPAELTGLARDLWIVDHEFNETSLEMHRLRAVGKAGGSTHGLAALGKRLDALMDRRAKLRPPPPPTPDEEERRWRAQANAVIAIIEAGVVAAEAELAPA